MEPSPLEIIRSFTTQSLPDLDVVTLAALELFAQTSVPAVDFGLFQSPLVIGSVNALSTGRMLFRDRPAIFANESDYKVALGKYAIDGVFLLSASGSKHAVGIAQYLAKAHIPTVLLTTDPHAPALQVVGKNHSYVFPRNREPYSYNTSTYMGMLLSVTKEDPQALHAYITNVVAPSLPDSFSGGTSFTFILPPAYGDICAMLRVKFDELFGPLLVGQAFTSEEIKHAKTIVHSDGQYFVSIGEENDRFGNTDKRLQVPLPADADYVAVLAISYFIVGRIQASFPPYFKDGIAAYAKELGEMFGNTFNPIVE